MVFMSFIFPLRTLKEKLVAHICNPSYSGGEGRGRRIANSRPAWARLAPSQKQDFKKGLGGVAHAVRLFIREATPSIPNIAKIKKKF
jgi:hypothetical protein